MTLTLYVKKTDAVVAVERHVTRMVSRKRDDAARALPDHLKRKSYNVLLMLSLHRLPVLVIYPSSRFDSCLQGLLGVVVAYCIHHVAASGYHS